MSAIVSGPDTVNVLRKLRSPCARSALLKYPFSSEGRGNPGYTLSVPEGEPAVAPGNGTVKAVVYKHPDWAFSPGDLTTQATYEVTIDHGMGVETTVAGLSAVFVGKGASVNRGDELGPLVTQEIFFSIRVNQALHNPVLINRHFMPLNEGQVSGQGHKIRFAPDKLLRNLSNGLSSTLESFVRFFCPPVSLLINIDFNGNGTKTGGAATGITTSDFWNVYAPVAFTDTSDPNCYYNNSFGHIFSGDPAQFLNDYRNLKSAIRLEKVAPLTADSGSHVSFDAMLSTYIGGYDFAHVPFENSFNLRGMPDGTYDLYLYADATDGANATDFYISINGKAETLLQNAPIGATSFIQGDNYVLFDNFVLGASDYVTIRVVGFLSGLQLRRV
jgi:Peptidase family M23